MELKPLTYFCAIVEEGSITAAARRLHMAQPPLSQCLKALEEELGARLLERGPRRVTLTDAGKLLYERAQRLLSLARSTCQEVSDLGQGLRGTLRLGTVSSSGGALVGERLRLFHEAHPGIRFDIREGNTYELMDLLQTGIIEVAVVRTPFPSEGLHCRYLTPEPMVAVQPPGQTLGDGRAVTLEEVAAQPLLIYKRFQSLLSDTFAAHGLPAQFLCQAEDARTVLLWVQAGLGVGLVPHSALQLGGGGQLAAVEVDEPALVTRIAVIWMWERYVSNLARQFLTLFDGEAQP